MTEVTVPELAPSSVVSEVEHSTSNNDANSADTTLFDFSRLVDGAQYDVPLRLIDTNPNQPRSSFNDAEQQEMTDSLRWNGLLQDLIVQPMGERFRLIAGERRLRSIRLLAAAKQLPEIGYWGTPEEPTVRCMVRMVDDATAIELAIAENRDRKNINPIDEARGFAELQRLGRTQEQIAARFKMTQSGISNAIRLLDLPETVRKHIVDGTLSASHGETLLMLDTPTEQEEFALETVKAEPTISVATLRSMVREHKAKLEAERQPALFEEAPKATPDSVGEVEQIPTDATTETTPSNQSTPEVEGEAPQPEASATDSTADTTTTANVTATTPEPAKEKPKADAAPEKQSAPETSKTEAPKTDATKPKAPEGMTSIYAPTDDVFFCEDHGLPVKDVYALATRLIALAEARSITPDEYLTALEEE